MKKPGGTAEFLAYTLVGIASAAISFATMVVLTRTTSAAFFGRLNKFITASNVVMSLVCLGLDSAYIRFYYEPPEHTNSKQLAWTCMVPGLIALACISVIILPLGNHSLLRLLIGGGGLFFGAAFVATVLAQFLNRFMTIHFRMGSHVLGFSVACIALAVLTRTVFIPLHWITPEFERAIVAAAVLFIAFMGVFFMIHRKNMVEASRWDLARYRPVYRFALLSSPVFAITYLNGYLPQIIVSGNLGDDILGVYSAALLFCSAIQVLSSGFTTFWSPYMFKNYKTEQATIKRVHDAVLLGSVLILALILVFNDVIYLFIGEAFRRNQNVLGMLLVYPVVLIIVETTAYGISIEKKNEISLAIYLVSTATNVALCLALISRHGLAGVAFASMVSAIVQMILMTIFGQKYYRSINHIGRTAFHMLVLVLSAVLFYFLYDNRPVFVIAEVALVAACIACDKSVLRWSCRLLQSKWNTRGQPRSP